MRHQSENKNRNIGHRARGKGYRHKIFYQCSALCILFAIAAFGCATTGEQAAIPESQGSVLTAIDITDNKVAISADKPFKYTVYKSSDPYKVIAEFPDMRLGIAPAKIKSDKKGITEITPLQVEQPLSTRLEILLASPVSVEPIYEGTLLTLNVEEEPKAAEAPKAEEKVQEVKVTEEKIEEPATAEKTAETVKPEEKTAMPEELSPATSITQINIEKAEDAVKVIIKGDGVLSPNVFRLDNRAVLDMPNVTMAASVPAAVPPLKNIRAGKYKDKTRLVFDLKGKIDFDVTAAGDSVIVSFPIPEKEKYAAKAEKKAESAVGGEIKIEAKVGSMETEKPAEGKYKGQKISLDFQDADIGPIFRLLADISGYNFVIDPAVKGKITLKLINVPWDQALDIILQTFALGKQEEGNIIWIAPVNMFAKMAEDKTKAKDVEEKAEDIVQEIVRINYATAADISKAITDAKIVSKDSKDRGITMDTRMNTLIIKDTQKNIEKIKALVKVMDVAKPQVMIEAKIVEVGSSYSETLGIRWGGTISTTQWGGPGSQTTVGGNFSVNTPTVTAGPSTTNPGGVLGLTIGSANTATVSISLSALESIGKSKRLSNPKVMTMDNEAATIQQGVSIPVSTVSAEGTKTEYVNATLSLGVTPKVTPDGYVQMKINATNNALGILTPQGYSIETKSVTTQALVKNGDTLVIGGIYTTNTTEGTEGVPLLSKIPLLGWLFKTKTQTGPNVTELLVFITPTIVTKP